MAKRHVVVILLGAVLLAGALSATAQSSLRTATGSLNYLTFSQAFALPGISMAAGTYKFESGPNGTNINIVRVSSKNGQRTFYQGLTTPIAHRGAEQGPVMFGEAASGIPLPMVAWHPIGSTQQGYGFQYP
jgi:hypothetical protein